MQLNGLYFQILISLNLKMVIKNDNRFSIVESGVTKILDYFTTTETHINLLSQWAKV